MGGDSLQSSKGLVKMLLQTATLAFPELERPDDDKRVLDPVDGAPSSQGAYRLAGAEGQRLELGRDLGQEGPVVGGLEGRHVVV